MKILSKLFSKGLTLALFAFSLLTMSGCGSSGDSVTQRSLEDFAQVGLCVVTCLIVANQIVKRLSKRQTTLS